MNPDPLRPACEITAGMVKNLLMPFAQKKLVLPLLIFVLDGAVYGVLVIGAVVLPQHWQRLICGTLAGFATGMLFVIGHDACHGSYTRHQWLNRVLGRIAFLPSLHAFSTWHLGHNQIHHRFTNLKSEDYVWRPYSKHEFDRLSKSRQLLERLYRTTVGLGLYYAAEIWWKKIIFPSKREVQNPKGSYFWDSCFVATFACLQVVAVIWLGNQVNLPWYTAVGFGVILPFCAWNWFMGFAIYQHHTHPSVAWFDDVEEWNYWESQIAGTTHVRFPRLIGWLMHNIMEHTAHHAFTRVPLYNLIKAQSAIEAEFTSHVKVVPWTLKGFIETLRRCKLYDYERHVWQDFSGNDTSSPAIPFSSFRSKGDS